MNRQFFIPSFIVFISLISSSYAASIRQCRQSDGTIVFTNKSCSKSSLSRSSVFNNTFTNKKNYRKQPPFRQTSFIRLQNQMINAHSREEIEEHAQTIINKVLSYANKGKINTAYDMIAASYATISKNLKRKQWEDQTAMDNSLKIRSLFEEILISQSTTSTIKAFDNVVQSAWVNYYNKSITQ